MSMTPSRRAIERVTLGDLAADNRLFVVRCHLCQKTENYLASDLATVMGAHRPAHTMFGHCPHCGKSEWVNVRVRLPDFDDIGRLRIRRPKSKRVVWSWEDAVYAKPE